MRRCILTLVLLCFSAVCEAADFRPFDGPKPILIFIQTEPWLDVIGSDTPRVAIYEDGRVIYTKKVKKQWTYYHCTFDKAGLERVSADA